MNEELKPVDPALSAIYRESAEAWGGVHVSLRHLLGRLVNCTSRLLRVKSAFQEAAERLQRNKNSVVAQRSDLGQELAWVICILEQNSVLLGLPADKRSVVRQVPAADFLSAVDNLVVKLVEMASRVDGHLNYMENNYREGLPKPTGDYLGANCLVLREDLLAFTELLFKAYPLDQADYESSRERAVETLKTNRPQTTYVLREFDHPYASFEAASGDERH